jgi:hypothetical protein
LNAFCRISTIPDIGEKKDSEYDNMHIQLITGFISGFFHISGQHRFVGGASLRFVSRFFHISGQHGVPSLENLRFFGRSEGLVRTCCGRGWKGTGGSREALGAKKAALKILRFTLFVVSQAWDLVKKDILQTRCACV